MNNLDYRFWEPFIVPRPLWGARARRCLRRPRRSLLALMACGTAADSGNGAVRGMSMSLSHLILLWSRDSETVLSTRPTSPHYSLSQPPGRPLCAPPHLLEGDNPCRREHPPRRGTCLADAHSYVLTPNVLVYNSICRNPELVGRQGSVVGVRKRTSRPKCPPLPACPRERDVVPC